MKLPDSKKTAITIYTVLILALCIAAPSFAGNDSELPENLLELLPAEPSIMATFKSIEDVDDQWKDWMFFANAENNITTPTKGLKEYLAQTIPGYELFIDQDRPLVICMSIPVMMQAPAQYIVVPLKDNSVDEQLVLSEGVMTSYTINEDYILFTSDKFYSAAATVPAIAEGIGGKLATVRIDLEGLLTTMRPIIEMGLGSLAMAAAMDTTKAGPAMTPEAMLMIQEQVYDFINSSKLLELSLDNDHSETSVAFKYNVLPGSPLLPVDQPSLSDAIELAGFLPEDRDLLAVVAGDFTDMIERSTKFQHMNQSSSPYGQDPEMYARYSAWLTECTQLTSGWTNNMAYGGYFEEQQIEVCTIVKIESPQKQLQEVVRLTNELTDIGMGYIATSIEVPEIRDHKVYGWHLSINRDFMELLEENFTPEQFEAYSAMVTIQDKLVSNVYVCAIDDYLTFSLGADTDKLAEMVKSIDRDRSRTDKTAKRIAKRAGSDCQMVVYGDLRKLLTLSLEIMEEMDPDGRQYNLPGNKPLRFSKTLNISEDGYLGEIIVPEKDMAELLKAMGQLFAEH